MTIGTILNFTNALNMVMQSGRQLGTFANNTCKQTGSAHSNPQQPDHGVQDAARRPEEPAAFRQRRAGGNV